MSPVPLPTRVFLACGVTDMRKGFDGLAVLVHQVLAQNPHSGALFASRGKRGQLVKPHQCASAVCRGICRPRMSAVCPASRCSSMPWSTPTTKNDHLRDWYGGPFNADDVDERFTCHAVAAIAIRRHAGKLAYQKSRTR